MVEKILKIKLEVETGQSAKLVDVVNNITVKTNTLISKSKELLAAEAKVTEARNAAVSSLSKVIVQAEQYTNLLKQGGTAAYLANTQAKAGLDSYNSKLIETQNNLKKLIIQHNILSTTEQTSFAFASGQSKAPSFGYKPSASDTANQGIRARNPLTGQAILAETSAQDKLKESILSTNKARLAEHSSLDLATEKHRSLVTRIVEGVSIYRIYTTAINLAEQALLNIPKAGIQQQANKASIFAIFGSEEGKANLKFIKDLGNSAGQVITDLEQSYAKFAPSAKLAGATQGEINQTFKDFTEVATVLNLSKDKVDSVFLALDQIFSKGVVQSEEIKKQLGNALPGAVEIGALAMKKTPAEFIAAMKKNEVIAKDFVPKFAALYRQIFGGVDDSVFKDNSTKLLSNLNRLQNVYTEINRKIYADISGGLNSAVKLAASTVETLSNNLVGLQQTIKLTAEILIARLTLGALVSLPAAILAASSAVNVLSKAVLGLSAPWVGLIVLWGLAINKLADLNIGYEQTTGFTIKLKEETVSLANFIENTLIISLNRLLAALTTIKEISISDLFGSNVDQRGNNTSVSFIDQYAANLEKISKGSTDIVTKTIEDQRQLVIDSFKDKSVLEIQEAFAKGVLRNNEELIKALNANDFIAKPIGTTPVESEVIAEEKLAKIKEINFNKETNLNDARIKQLEKEAKGQLDIIEGKKKALEIDAQRAIVNNKPIPEQVLNASRNNLEEQKLNIQVELEKKKQQLATDSINIIIDTAKKSVITVDQFYKKLQDIESAGVKTRGGREGAISITGALGRGQVQPSTLNDYTRNVPADILSLEKKARFNLNVLKKKVTLDPSEIEKLRDYALANVDKINEVSEKLFKKLVDDFGGDFIKAAVAYNTGPGRVKLASKAAAQAGREDFEAFLPTSGKLGLNPRALAEAQDYARKARAAQAGENFEPALIAKQTEQQTAIDAQRIIAQDKYLQQKQKQLDLDTLLRDIKKEEAQLNIESLEASGNTKEAELAKLQAEYAIKYAEAERLGSEFLKQRLPIVEQFRIKQIELKDLSDKYNANEQQFQAQVQEYTNKSLVGRIKNFQIAGLLGQLESEYIAKQRINLEQSLLLTNNTEQQLAIKQKLALLEQRQSESAAFNRNFVTPPEVNNFASDTARIEQSKRDGLALAEIQYIKDLNDRKIEAEIEFQERKKQVEEEYAIASRVNLETQYAAGSAYAASAFGVIGSAASAAFGQQSEAARAAFALQKAFLVAEAIMTAQKAALAAEASGNAINPALGPVFAALSYASTAAKIATIIATPVPSGGAAHGGLDNVPKEQTYLLDKGERVLSPRQNVDITNKVTNIHDKVNTSTSPNIRIVNVMDENLVYNALGSDQAEKVIMNIVNRNR
jgi:tape measure domain-containing protein